MWSTPFTPANPRHSAALMAAGLMGIIAAVLIADLALPALAAHQLAQPAVQQIGGAL